MSNTFRVICNSDPLPAVAVACLLVDEPLSVRVDFGEPGDVALAASSPLVATAAPEGAELVVNGATVTGFSKPGAYKLKCTFATGQFRWLDVFVFEPRCLDLVPVAVMGRSSGRNTTERRRVLRALAQDPSRKDGTFAALTSGGLNLAQFGG
jgi:hypothetical protein